MTQKRQPFERSAQLQAYGRMSASMCCAIINSLLTRMSHTGAMLSAVELRRLPKILASSSSFTPVGIRLWDKAVRSGVEF